MVKYPQRAALVSAALLLFSGCVHSQAPIVDASGSKRSSTQVQPAAPAPSAGVELLLGRVQALEAEVMQLRGIIEEQGYQLETLKQQSLERYIELDKRLGAAAAGEPLADSQPLPGIAGGDAGGAVSSADRAVPVAAPAAAEADSADAAPAAPAPQATAEQGAVATAAPQPATGQTDMEAYREAYGRVKAQDFVGAKQLFQGFLTTFPDSNLVPNAHYWLGELYLQSPQDLDAAEKAFNQVLTQFPNHDKAPDALYKLGRIAHMRGDNVRAQELLQQVIDEYGASGSAAPQLAKQFLDQAFR